MILVNDHLVIIALLYILFSVVAMIAIVKNIVKTHKISIMSMCCVMYIAILCIVPAFIFFGKMNGLYVGTTISFEEDDIWTLYVQLLLTVIGYAVMNFGYSIKQRNVKEKESKRGQNLMITAIIFSFISIVSLFLWSSGYGGIAGLLKNANEIRAGWIGSSNSFAFFKHFVPLSLLASWMLFNFLIRKTVKRILYKTLVIILLICDGMISSIYIQANDGRFLLAAYILLFFIIYLKYQYEVKDVNITPVVVKFCVILLIVILILFNAEAILNFMRGEEVRVGETSNILSILSGEFSFIISGTQTALAQWAAGEAELMIDNDIVNGLFAWLPTSLKPVMLEDVWDHNTNIIASNSYGQAPTSIVAQSIYDLSWIGIIIIPLLYGVLIKKLENIFDSHKGNIFFETAYVVLGFYLCKGVAYFSLYNIMINIFFIFIGIVIYSIMQKIKL